MSSTCKICVFVCLALVSVKAAKSEYRSDGGFMPSFHSAEDQLSEPTARVDNRDERDNQPERTQRFGITGYGSTGTQGGFGSTAPGLYGPVKIDLGGVLLGSLLGFGAVIILPKLINAFSYSYGGYGRSIDTDLNQVSDVFNKMDEVLHRYNIDSSACVQRLACSYVQVANENMGSGNATELDAFLSSMSKNSLVRRMLDGTSVYEAIAAGRSLDADCQTLYPKCKLNKNTMVKMLSQVIPSY